jgi:predicted deacylase
MQEIVLKSDYGIDIHSGSFHRVNYPQIRTNISNEINFELAKAFNPPLIINANFRDGSLRNASNQANIPLILYEAGEVLRFDEASIDIGLRGILNVMRKINMLENDVDISCTTNHNEIFVAYSSSWIRATKSGIFNCKVKLGMMIKKNEILGSIANPFGDNPVIIKSNLDGMIVGLSMMPLVNKGDAIIHVASDSTKNINQKILVDDN